MSISISFTGNLTGDPELKFLPSGIPVASFTVAVSKRVKADDGWKDGPTSFVRCTAWRQYAENVAESLAKGTKVVVIGSMSQREYETKEGEKRSVWECQVEDVGPALRNATASVRKVERSKQADGFGAYQDAKAAMDDDPWTTPTSEEAPF
jgi:single-strand DNA-binding protein